MIYELIRKLVAYAEVNGLIRKEDEDFTINRLLELFQLEDYLEPEEQQKSIDQFIVHGEEDLEQILAALLDYAYKQGIIKENSTTNRDLLDAKIMGLLLPNPSIVIDQFYSYYTISPKVATDYYYQFSQSTDYIRKYRIKKDIKWSTNTQLQSKRSRVVIPSVFSVKRM